MPGAVHGKDFFFSVATKDMSLYTKTTNWEVDPGIHDISGSGIDDQTFRGGQINRKFTAGGWYDSSLTLGPGFIQTLAGTTVAMVRRIQGTGSGRPEQAFSAVVGKYVESQKNDDVTQWTCDFQVTGVVTNSTQA